MKPGSDYPATLDDLKTLKTAMPLLHNGKPFQTIGQELAAELAKLDDPKWRKKHGRKRQRAIRSYDQRPRSPVQGGAKHADVNRLLDGVVGFDVADGERSSGDSTSDE